MLILPALTHEAAQAAPWQAASRPPRAEEPHFCPQERKPS
jgi:hypothetical protein